MASNVQIVGQSYQGYRFTDVLSPALVVSCVDLSMLPSFVPPRYFYQIKSDVYDSSELKRSSGYRVKDNTGHVVSANCSRHSRNSGRWWLACCSNFFSVLMQICKLFRVGR